MKAQSALARRAHIRHRLLAATSIVAFALSLAHGARADAVGGYQPYPISSNPSDWTVDRSDAATFGNVGSYRGRDEVLKLGITPPAAPYDHFNWQGYQQKTTVPSGNSFLRGDMWVANGWQTGTATDFVNTGMWGSAMPSDLVAQGNYVDQASVFPIVHFSNQDGTGRLVVWDTTANPTGGWVDLPQTAGLVKYDDWNTIDLRLLPEEHKIEYLFNGQVVYTWDMPAPDNPAMGAPEQFFAMYLKARNNGVTSFDTYWSRLLSGVLIQDDQEISDTPGDVLVDPDSESIRKVNVAADASVGGSVMSDGGNTGAIVAFNGNATITNDVIGDRTSFEFSKDPNAQVVIGNNVELENGSATSGGTVVNPIQVGGDVGVDDTSTLGGNWNVGGSLNVDGTLSPGNSIGVVTVAGNHAFGPSSEYDVEVNADGNADRLNVGGTATLDGTVKVSPLNGRNDIRLGHAYTIVTAGGGFGGTAFDSVSWDQQSAFLAPELSYDPNNVFVTIDRNGVPFASAAATPNQAAAASGLDSLSFGNQAHDAVALSTTDVARQAYDSLSGEIHASTKGVLLEESHYLRDAVNGRLRQAFASNGTEDSTVDVRPIAGTAMSMWMQGFGALGQVDGNDNAASLDHQVGGFIGGIDAPLSDTWRVGLAGGYSRSGIDADGRASSANVDSYHLAAYAGTKLGPVGLRFGAANTWHSVDTSRSIRFPGFSDSASADYDARTTQVFGEIGYPTDVGGIALEPFANLAYVNQHTGGFTEKGGDAALRSEDENEDAKFSTLGLRASKKLDLDEDLDVSLRGMIGWRHAFDEVAPSAVLSFDGGAPFSVEGSPIARDAAVVELGFDVGITPDVSVGAAYTSQLSSGAVDHGFMVNLTVKF